MKGQQGKSQRTTEAHRAGTFSGTAMGSHGGRPRHRRGPVLPRASVFPCPQHPKSLESVPLFPLSGPRWEGRSAPGGSPKCPLGPGFLFGGPSQE